MANITCQVTDPASRPVAGLRVMLSTLSHRIGTDVSNFTACTSVDGRVDSWTFCGPKDYTLRQFFDEVVGDKKSIWKVGFGTSRFWGKENTSWPLIDINIYVKKNASHHISLVVGPDDYRSYLDVQPTLPHELPASECDKPEQEAKGYLVRPVERPQAQVEAYRTGSALIATDVVQCNNAKMGDAATNGPPSEAAFVTKHAAHATSHEGPVEQDVRVEGSFMEQDQSRNRILVEVPEAENQSVLKGRVGKTTKPRRSSRRKCRDARA